MLAGSHPFEDAGPYAMGASQVPGTGTNAAADGEGDPVHGKEVFEKRCTGCHAMTHDREGPRLAGVYGRTSGGVAGFAYSPELKKAQIVWTEKTLDSWLADPDAFVPGNNMEFRVAKPQERRDVIRFLRQSKDK
jgi:cytochrome c